MIQSGGFRFHLQSTRGGESTTEGLENDSAQSVLGVLVHYWVALEWVLPSHLYLSVVVGGHQCLDDLVSAAHLIVSTACDFE